MFWCLALCVASPSTRTVGTITPSQRHLERRRRATARRDLFFWKRGLKHLDHRQAVPCAQSEVEAASFLRPQHRRNHELVMQRVGHGSIAMQPMGKMHCVVKFVASIGRMLCHGSPIEPPDQEVSVQGRLRKKRNPKSQRSAHCRARRRKRRSGARQRTWRWRFKFAAIATYAIPVCTWFADDSTMVPSRCRPLQQP